MRKRTFWSIFIPSLCSLIIAVIIVSSTIYSDAHKDLLSEIRYQAQYTADILNSVPSSERHHAVLLGAIEEKKGHRITLIDVDGTVIYDSVASLQELENHADRPEVASAMESGRGEATRASDTLESETFYCAIRLNEGHILRIGSSVKSSFGILLNVILVAIPTVAILAVVALFIAILLSRKLSRPLKNLDLDNPMRNKTYEELSPVLDRVEEKNLEIAEAMEDLARKRSEFDHVTANMSEGIMLFSSDGALLSANKSSRAVITLSPGASYSSLSDDSDVIPIIEHALKGEKNSEKISRAGKTYRLTATPVKNPFGEYSVVLLILDVTSTEQAESLRREFSANVSHELKTPLTTILGYAEIISNGIAQSDDIPTFATQIHSEASRLLTLIDDIIKLSRLDEKNIVSEFEEVSLLDVARSVCDQLSEKAEALEISLSCSGSDQSVRGLRHVIYEIIFNLTDNAITYNRRGGKVNISIVGDSIHPTLTVTDTGIGIPDEDRERVFERFYRVDKSHSKETGGTGLGLSIVKHGALLHGAEVTLESELDKGTSVRVKF
ncbi:MAG: histidine kinase [Clostridia bacterium]|nr:histidine kinase [Clostridia bacterium]